MIPPTRWALLAAVLAASCGGPQTEGPPGSAAWCDSDFHVMPSYGAGELLHPLPSDAYTRPDPTARTGLRVDLRASDFPASDPLPAVAGLLLDALNRQDGFGTYGSVTVLLSEAPSELPPPEDTARPGTPVVLAPLDAPDEAVQTHLAFEPELGALHVTPWRPLDPGRTYVLVARSTLLAADGRCLAPDPGAPEVARLAEALPALTDAGLVDGPGDVAAATVFTTQSLGITERAAAAQIERDGALQTREQVHAALVRHDRQPDIVRWIGQVHARDWRGQPPQVLEPAPTGRTEVPIHLHLPPACDQPAPVVIFGHGFGGHAGLSRSPAKRLVPAGFAVLAADAVAHGERLGPGQMQYITFLGVDPQQGVLDPSVVVDSLRQTGFEVLELVEIIRSGAFDGLPCDAGRTSALDPDRIYYFGQSMGAVIGSLPLALSTRLSVGVLNVGGAGMTTLLDNSPTMQPFHPILFPAELGAGHRLRWLALAQGAVDAGDPINYAPGVLDPTVDAERADPPVLLQLAADDDFVPPVSGLALARALGTAAVEQFDSVTGDDGQPTAATHEHLLMSAEGSAQWLRFLTTATAGAPKVASQ